MSRQGNLFPGEPPSRRPRRRGAYPIKMPRDNEGRLIPLDQLVRYQDLGPGTSPILVLCLPLTPTQNEHQRWQVSKRIGGRVIHFSKGRHFRSSCLTLATHQVRATLGRFEPPWAQRVALWVVRCGPRPCDPTNISAGLKEALDVLLISRTGRPGVGLIPDDSDRYLVNEGSENRSRPNWGPLPGPGTWFFLTKIK